MTRRSRAGYTLLEVMIALSILFAALVILIRMSGQNARATRRARLYTVATNLARFEMLELEEKLLHDGFSSFDQPQDGDFSDEGYPQFKYEATFDKVELPQLQDLQNQAGQQANGNSQAPALNGQQTATPGLTGPDSLVNGMGSGTIGLSMVGAYLPLIQPILQNAIQRVNLDVTFLDGKETVHVKVSSFFTDTKAIDQAAQMLGALPPPGGPPTSSSAPPPPGGHK